MVRKEEVQPVELLEEAIRRIEKVDPQVNAVSEKTYDRAREALAGDLPDRPYRGVPFLIKDNLADYAGVASRRAGSLCP